MKKILIGSLVGAILVFAWQAAAHMFLKYHDVEYEHVANQDAIIQSLSSQLTKEGQYLVPRANPNATQQEMERYDDSLKGKPWAVITYHTAYDSKMGTAVIRGLATAFICVLIFILILGANPGTFGTVFLKSLGLGFLMFMFIHYNDNIWMMTPWKVIQPELIDLLVEWGLCGIWLGWYLPRRERTM